MARCAVVAADDQAASVGVLGAISVYDAGRRPVAIGGEKPRRLLAVLVLHRNAVVSTDRLIDVMWGDDVPDTAAATLQSYVSRLRRVLPPIARVVGEAPGYRLAVDPGATDVDRFETALAAADELDGAPDVALRLLDTALAEWKGDAFAEFADEWWAQAEAARLTELRLHARESRLVALLALGMDERAASEADALVADHPWRERGWRVLVSALHRAGRQGEALRRAGEYRARLGEELGLDPSPEFAALERDVATDAAPRHLPPVPSTATTPDEETTSPLIGREADEAGVLALIGRRRLVTLLGPGGIGKTQLAFRVAVRYGRETGVRTEVVELARVRDDDGVIGAVATQLDVQTQQGRSVLESVLDLLGDRPALLVLDNCEHVLDTIAGVSERHPAGLPAGARPGHQPRAARPARRSGLQGAGAGGRARRRRR